MDDPFEYTGAEDRDDDQGTEFDLGIPERFDPGYYGDWSQIPRICSECGKTFRPSENERPPAAEESALDDFCCGCLRELFNRCAAEAEEHRQLAKRLGMTIEEFLGLE